MVIAIFLASKRLKKPDILCAIDLTVTYFCKRGSHGACPGEWPMNSENGSTRDCTFDIMIAECNCQCHKKP
jgi:hypothetical protein